MWTFRQGVYTCIETDIDVTKPVNTFRSKIKKFLRKYKRQITENEIPFWKERLNITKSAVKTYKKKTECSEIHEPKIEVNNNFILSSLGEDDDDVIEIEHTEDIIYDNVEK